MNSREYLIFKAQQERGRKARQAHPEPALAVIGFCFIVGLADAVFNWLED